MDIEKTQDKVLGVATLTVDVRTQYPHRYEKDLLLFDKAGFFIGVVTDSVVQ